MIRANFQLTRFDPDTASDTVWEQLITLREIASREAHPDDPVSPRDLIRKRLEQSQTHPAFDLSINLLQRTGDDAFVAMLMLGFAKPESPDYQNQKHMAIFEIYVVEEHRGQGIGTMLLKEAVATCQQMGVTLLQAGSDTESGNAFAQRFQFEVSGQGKENRLYMKEVDWAMVEDWAQAGPQRAPGVQVVTFQGLYEEDLESYCRLYTEVFNQQPFDQMEGLEMTFTPERMRKLLERMQEQGSVWTTKISREPGGAVSGLTEIRYNPKQPHKVDQLLTGVQEAYRGRGLGKWLKAAMLLYVRETYPDTAFVSTGNADTNAPMLSINQRLGFKAYKQETAYKQDVAALAERLDL